MLDSHADDDGHDQPDAHDADGATISNRRPRVENDPSDETISGNSVDLQDEMIKLGEVNRDYAMTRTIKRVLHQMMMSVLK